MESVLGAAFAKAVRESERYSQIPPDGALQSPPPGLPFLYHREGLEEVAGRVLPFILSIAEGRLPIGF
jgi:hypothetical protein